MSDPSRIVLVTGADGFVGSEVCRKLATENWTVRRAVRRPSSSDADTFSGMSLSMDTDWTAALAGVQAVVHCAALVHRARGSQQQSEADVYHAVNVDGTARLARSAREAGVNTFVFLSSIAVLGDTTDGRAPFSDADTPAPVTVYGRSKLAGEQAIKKIAANSPMRLVVIRPPMIYGPNARGSLRQLLSAMRRGMPLPFAAIRNRRSFIGIQNLASFIAYCLKRPEVSGSYVVADSEVVSTPEFIRTLGNAIGKSPMIVWFPVTLLRPILDLVNLGTPLARSLEIDSSRLRTTGWIPELSLTEGLSVFGNHR